MSMKTAALATLGAITVAGGSLASTSTALPAVDAAPSISSATPVPGGLTVGAWAVTNASTTSTIPAGSTFIVTFEQLDGSLTPSSMTVTPVNTRAKTTKISNKEFRITLTQPLAPSQFVTGAWSDAHMFNIRLRDKVSIKLESAPGATDINASNNFKTYDNNGKGF